MDGKPMARDAGDEKSPASRDFCRWFDPPRTPGGTYGRVVRMDLQQASDLIRETLTLALIISAPMLIIGLVVGVVVSLLQAVTQIQEQTLSLIPKLAAMVGAAIVLMPWIGHRLMEYATIMFTTGLKP